LSGDGHVWTGPGRPQPGLFISRFAEVLSLSPESEANGESKRESGVVASLRQALSDVGRASGVPAAEIILSYPANFNAALRPVLTQATIDPHGPPPTSLQGVDVVADGPSARVWLRRVDAGTARDMWPIYNSGAPAGSTDACSTFLQLMAFAQGWETVSFGFPALEVEARWRHLPRLVLPGGTILSARRWTVDAAALRPIVASRGATRYQRWRALADQLHLPALLLARCGPRAPELLLRTDSPLAVRCLFDTIGARAPWMIFSELPADLNAWPVRDAAGNHHLAEIGVTWFADDGGRHAGGRR